MTGTVPVLTGPAPLRRSPKDSLISNLRPEHAEEVDMFGNPLMTSRRM